MYRLKNTALPLLSLFASMSTLVCCALPALLVSLGLGAALAGLVTSVPGIVWLSERKELVFGIAGTLLLLSALGHFLGRSATCPADPALANACQSARKWSKYLLIISFLAYFTGGFFAFVAPVLFF